MIRRIPMGRKSISWGGNGRGGYGHHKSMSWSNSLYMSWAMSFFVFSNIRMRVAGGHSLSWNLAR